MPALKERLRRGAWRAGHTCWVLVRVTVPTFILMEFLGRAGVIALLGEWCAPVMGVFRLPGEAAVPVALGLLVNVYTATAALGTLGLSGGQVTTLGLMIGLAHSLAVESTVLRAAGARIVPLLLYRLAAAALVGWAASRLLIGGGA